MCNITVSYFQHLFSAPGTINPWPIQGAFPAVLGDVLSLIHADFLDCEIKEAVFSMGPLKAPSPDGLHPLFFQSQWDIIGPSVCALVKDAFINPHRIADIN